jgi:hypothetical protein
MYVLLLTLGITETHTYVCYLSENLYLIHAAQAI